MKPENKFRLWYIKSFQSYLHTRYPGTITSVQKHADYATGGIPDLDITINGFTLWVEVKLLPACTRARRLDVSDLQRDNLAKKYAAGAPSGVLVGLPLGPRRGYTAAWFPTPEIPRVVTNSCFVDVQQTMDALYHMAKEYAERTHLKFIQRPQYVFPTIDPATLDVVVDTGECPGIKPMLDQLQNSPTSCRRGDKLQRRS